MTQESKNQDIPWCGRWTSQCLPLKDDGSFWKQESTRLKKKSQEILDEERKSRKIHETGRRENDRSRPSDTGTGNREGNGKNHSEVFFQIKYRQTGKEWTVRGRTGRDNEELFFSLLFFQIGKSGMFYICEKKSVMMRWRMLQREQTSCFSNWNSILTNITSFFFLFSVSFFLFLSWLLLFPIRR